MESKPSFAQLREYQRQFLQLRWNAICQRGDQAFYARSIETSVVTNALGNGASGVEPEADGTGSRHNLPSHAAAVRRSPLLTTLFLLADAASCGFRTRRSKFMNFGDGMIIYDDESVRVDYYPESVENYRSRRLAVALALVYMWLFCLLLAFWVFRDLTGTFSNLTILPYGSGTIHLLLSLSVVLTYAVGIMIVPRHNTVGVREGSLPSLLPLVLQTSHAQFMSSYAWSSRYVNLVRSLSAVLADCWLDVRELTPGDRVTQEIAHAAATARCLIIFFSYEYLRSVNCTLELLTALRYRGSPQRTIILIDALDGSAPPPANPKNSPLTAMEGLGVANLLLLAVPGLLVAKSVTELLDILDEQCLRSVDEQGVALAIEWWARHGKARVNRVSHRVRVVPPVLQARLRNYRAFVCSCASRKKGDVAGGFALISGDGSSVRWYQPPNAATITMIAVVFVEAIVYAHIFIYCTPAVDALTQGRIWFQGSCLPSSTFNYVTSLLPFVMVTLQYFINMKADASHIHDEILLPLNVAAHSASLRAVLNRIPDKADDGRPAFSFAELLTVVHESKDEGGVPDSAASSPASAESNPPRHHNPLSRAAPSRRSLTPNEGFSIIFVTSDVPRQVFSMFAEKMSDFITNYAVGIATSTIKVSAVPDFARRLAVYVFLLDSASSVDTFYRRVHCAPARDSIPWPTRQIVVLCHTDVLKTRGPPAPPERRRPNLLSTALSRTSKSKLPLLTTATPTNEGGGVDTGAELAFLGNSLQRSKPGKAAASTSGAGSAVTGSVASRYLSALRKTNPGAGRSTAASARVRARWRNAVKLVLQAHRLQRSSIPEIVNTAPVALDLPATGEDGCLSSHLRTALFEYLLIVTGSKNGVDASSPYDSLSEAFLDSVGRKVGSVLEAPRVRAGAPVKEQPPALVSIVNQSSAVKTFAPAEPSARTDERKFQFPSRASLLDRVVQNPLHARPSVSTKMR